MTEITMRREGNKLVPAHLMAEEDLATVPTGRDLLVKIRQPRNVRQFNLGWALAQKVAEACDWLHDKDDAMDYLLQRARHVKYFTNPHTGAVEIIVRSISWEKLKQDEFDRLFKRIVHIVLTEIMPGLPEGDLKAEIFKMIGAG